MNNIITNNEEETFKLGDALGSKCQGGEVFALYGDLGAGKTKLLQGLANGLKIKDKVNSPTFNILKVYNSLNSGITFCHVDAYRLRSGKDLADLGIEEFFDSPRTVTAIEWSENVEDIIPKRARKIWISTISQDKREIQFS